MDTIIPIDKQHYSLLTGVLQLTVLKSCGAGFRQLILNLDGLLMAQSDRLAKTPQSGLRQLALLFYERPDLTILLQADFNCLVVIAPARVRLTVMSAALPANC